MIRYGFPKQALVLRELPDEKRPRHQLLSDDELVHLADRDPVPHSSHAPGPGSDILQASRVASALQAARICTPSQLAPGGPPFGPGN